MVADAGSAEVQSLIERLRGPDARFVANLAAKAALHRPVIVDSAWAAEAVRPYTWLLNRIGKEGVRLTSSGYLPPAVVREAVTTLGWEDGASAHTRNREHLTLPVLELRRSARRMGLVRTYRGVLLRTALGARLCRDVGRLWWHVAGRLPDARVDAERDAGLLLLLAVASGNRLDVEATHDLLRRGMAALGWHDVRTGRPLDEWQVLEAARDTWACLCRLGVPGLRFSDGPAPPAPAGVALARAALRPAAAA